LKLSRKNDAKHNGSGQVVFLLHKKSILQKKMAIQIFVLPKKKIGTILVPPIPKKTFCFFGEIDLVQNHYVISSIKSSHWPKTLQPKKMFPGP